ncbi:hypothetical protein [Leifsonia shinshuensis]|uniref:hypothetical protein n=1 Tax=Leifsonia shinshuensis TaxID=150026 RepID=UPI00285EABE3|nr:hypothetical protein [Leifsonia shinshuensis]MDR6972975.1 hypothetical protein [Leifsonia shinshuensis]
MHAQLSFVEIAVRNAIDERLAEWNAASDVVAQLMFGTWVKIVRPLSPTESPSRQQFLWAAAVSHAFPHAPSGDDSRVAIGDQLDRLRRLRNRVAHHDNLLDVALKHRLNGMLSLLASLHPDYPPLAVARSTLRQLIGDDPRRTW